MYNQPSRRQYTRLISQVRVPGPSLPGYQIECHDPSRQFFINQLVIRCNPTEYKVLYFFLNHYREPLTCEELIALFDPAALEYPDLLERARRKLTKVVSDLRVKLWESGLTIFTEYRVGYLLDKQPAYPRPIPRKDINRLKNPNVELDQPS
ncbi:MAG: response regulator transcription factor [Ktedonobacteraceae bacterium]|nr:response regulator transcription factor [Ktedonobacteraceae bacterium]MBO0790240.1 response regulator transcription factor [Ktedonobacteraceae bacterium]